MILCCDQYDLFQQILLGAGVEHSFYLIIVYTLQTRVVVWNIVFGIKNWTIIGDSCFCILHTKIIVNYGQYPFRVLHCCPWTAGVNHFVLFWNSKSNILVRLDIVYDVGYDFEDAA